MAKRREIDEKAINLHHKVFKYQITQLKSLNGVAVLANAFTLTAFIQTVPLAL